MNTDVFIDQLKDKQFSIREENENRILLYSKSKSGYNLTLLISKNTNKVYAYKSFSIDTVASRRVLEESLDKENLISLLDDLDYFD